MRGAYCTFLHGAGTMAGGLLRRIVYMCKAIIIIGMTVAVCSQKPLWYDRF